MNLTDHLRSLLSKIRRPEAWASSPGIGDRVIIQKVSPNPTQTPKDTSHGKTA